jgi:hypothetical protein
MLIGFAIFITAVIVSVVVLLIYHFVIIGTNNNGGGSGGGGTGGYNYDVNIQYLNTLSAAIANAVPTGLTNYNSGNNFPELPSGADKFRQNLSKP